MFNAFTLLLNLLSIFATVLKPNGRKSLIAENIALRQQLIILQRGRKRVPNLTTYDRLTFALLASLIKPIRLERIAIIIKPTTIIKFHQYLVKRKYKNLFGNKSSKLSGRKPPSEELIQLVLSIKERNIKYGYLRISMQIYYSFGIYISQFSVGRILRKYGNHIPNSNNDGPSWLTFLGHAKGSLWSILLKNSYISDNSPIILLRPNNHDGNPTP